MREIKFRVFRKDHEKIFEPFTIQELWVDFTPIEKDDADHVVFMQYTGLKDKNGKEIYEGDILGVDTELSPMEQLERGLGNKDIIKVYYDSESLAWLWENDSNTIDYLSELYSDDIEVIGNIYENKELLENK